jgi:hypothetical protein
MTVDVGDGEVLLGHSRAVESLRGGSTTSTAMRWGSLAARRTWTLGGRWWSVGRQHWCEVVGGG